MTCTLTDTYLPCFMIYVLLTFCRTCPVCDLPFSDAAFVRYPNGIVTHIKCSKNKTICPVTGKWFGANAN